MNLLLLLSLLPGELPLVESKTFPQPTQQKALLATVRIVNTTKNQDGTGVILRQNGAFVYVLTAGHHVERGDALRIKTYSDTSYPNPSLDLGSAEVLEQSLVPDLAVLRVVSKDKILASLPICPLRQAPEGKKIPALAVGCPRGEAPALLLDTLSGKRLLKKPGTDSPSRFWQAEKDIVAGRSGGPLVDRQGRLIGIASGSGDGRGYYTHLEEIHDFMRGKGLRWLLEP